MRHCRYGAGQRFDDVVGFKHLRWAIDDECKRRFLMTRQIVGMTLVVIGFGVWVEAYDNCSPALDTSSSQSVAGFACQFDG